MKFLYSTKKFVFPLCKMKSGGVESSDGIVFRSDKRQFFTLKVFHKNVNF